MQNRITQLFKIQYPIIQAGMVWCSGWKLASAVSNSGGLGIIGAGSMYPEVLKQHIQKCKLASNKPFAVNLPLLYPSIEEHIKTIIEEHVPIVFTSAGNPKTWTSHLKAHGITVVHVVSSSKFALKSEAAGVDAIVAEGFEAGGHNGREETTTLCLIPEVCKHVKIPVIGAGGIGAGKAMLACFALGAEAVQIGSRFVMCEESSAHANYKNALLQAKEGDTEIRLKSITPVRLFKNKFYEQIKSAEEKGASPEELRAILGKGRAKKGMFEGELLDGELEIGQVAAQFENILPAADVVQEIWQEFLKEKERLSNL
jgi:enoyl-[acyl-carrier protein] reductase II|tara:strand:- start:5190 stop:6131 length:942 start_codon:yes stop_codon:yes gene_type:complete